MGGGASAQTAPPREIEYAYPDQSVWTTRVNARGEPDNPLLRFADRLFAIAGIPWHGKPYPAARLFSYLADGTAEFSMLVDATALRRCCLVGRSPVATAEIRIYRRGDVPSVASRENLSGKRVITIHGYSYGGLLNYLAEPSNNVSVNSAIRHEAAFAMLEAGRADYLIDYAGPAGEVTAAHPIAGLRYDVLARQDVFLVLSKTYPDAPAVMARLEAIAATLGRDEFKDYSPR